MYTLESVAWEVTMGCNLSCEHCGSACRRALPGELNTRQALDLLTDLAELKVKWIALTGGEPLIRNDIFDIIAASGELGIRVRVITNGMLITPETVEKLAKLKVEIVSISIDGLCEQHNVMRGVDCFDRCCNALRMLHHAGVPTAVNTTIVKANLNQLDALKHELSQCGVLAWQLQAGLPWGRLSNHSDWVVDVSDISSVVDFAYVENLKNDWPKIFLADSIGYFSNKEMLSRQCAYGCRQFPVWNGCNAGISSAGILYNGDVTGCISIRDSRFTEGNICDRSMVDIWNDPASFSWRRNMTPAMLKGRCGSCVYVERCLGGCSNVRLCITGELYADNPLCLYRHSTL